MITFRRASIAALVVAAVACGGSTIDSITVNDASLTDTATPTSEAGSQDGSTQPDTSVSVAPIPCGNGPSCDPNTQVCCATQQGASCTAKGQCQGASFSCAGTANCTNNEVCCGTLQGQSIQAICQPVCAGQSVQLCQGDNECKAPDTCRPVFQGLKVCAPPIPDGGFKFDASPPPKDAGGPG
jgi:hypothetical protein